ncbi:MAG: hypothetical protein WCG87_04605 [Bacteroidota bacterium]
MKKIIDKKFDAVAYMREQRQSLSVKLATMSKKEILEYFRQTKKHNTVKPSA